MTDIANLQDAFALTLTVGQVLRHLGVALLCGLLIARFHVAVAGQTAQSRTFVASLVALTLITAVVIMVIGNNLARAFGLVGAMSIVRFRTAVKDVQDIVFIFFGLAIGMAAGVGLAAVACVGTGAIGLVLVLVTGAQRRLQRRRDYLLQLQYLPGGSGEAGYLATLQRLCAHHQLINVRSTGDEGRLDLAFYVRLRDPARSAELIDALGAADGVQGANLFLDEEYS